MEYNKVPIVMICDENFAMQTKVALTSLWLNKNQETIYDVYVIAVECGSTSVKTLEAMQQAGFSVSIIKATTEQFSHINQISHVSLACLYKFNICDLIPGYDKILYLDGDIIVRGDLSGLYATNLGKNYVAGVAHSLGIISGERKINGGVLLFNAAKIREENLKEAFIRTREQLGDRKSMDQETFHLVFGESKVFLPPKYNVMMDKIDYEKKYYSLKKYNHFYGTCYKTREEIFSSALIMHFTGSIKPWKYTFAKGFKEWYRYYQSAYGDAHRLNLKDRKDFLCQEIKTNGWRSLYWLLKDKGLAFMGEYFHLYLDKSYGTWN